MSRVILMVKSTICWTAWAMTFLHGGRFHRGIEAGYSVASFLLAGTKA